ncbi:hypothetical protein CVT24_008254 [Panaeolus cyanescens]|uniref:Uncharacterized protein n=1 Tax=Panaeolus cyanescens TaxID=181874 RepID=A0A409VF79_9AGAR|nr:hypothetical protein CVT24_008254 [Panaeolus cyanescens]
MHPPCMSNVIHRARTLKQKLSQTGPANATIQESTESASCFCTPPFDHIPHDEYLQGNEVPSPDEQKDLRAFIRRASDHSVWMKYQLDDLIYKELGESTEKLRESLQQEISQLDGRISEAQTIMAPVRRLTSGGRLRCPPLHFGATYLPITAPATQQEQIQAAVMLYRCFKCWSIGHSVATNTAEDAYVDPILSLLVDQSERWADVSVFNLDSFDFRRIPVLLKIKGRLRNLKYLQLDLPYDWWTVDSVESPPFADLLYDTPILQSLVYHQESSIRLPRLPLQHLTCIKIPLYRTDDLQLIASCADTLQSLYISCSMISGYDHNFSQSFSDITADPPVYEFPQLTTLCVTCFTTEVFDFLKVPTLENLAWRSDDDHVSYYDLNSLCEMLARSSNSFQPGSPEHHPLKSLCITNVGDGFPCIIGPGQEPQERLLRLFQMTPHLSTLHIPCPGTNVLHALTSGDDADQVLIPSLEFCVFTLSYTRTEDLQSRVWDDEVEELMGAYNDFASSRCGFSTVMPEHEGGQSGVRRLNSFLTVFKGIDGSYMHQSALRPLVPNISTPPKRLNTLLDDLAQALPGAFSEPWDPWNPVDKPVWHPDWYQWRSKLVQIFFQIEALDLDTTGWHQCLDRLRKLFRNDDTFYESHRFIYEIVRDMHEGCIRKFDENPWMQRWLLFVPNSERALLAYIPQDHPIMSTSYAYDIVYDRGLRCRPVFEMCMPLSIHLRDAACVNLN